MQKIAIHSFGCKLNFAESASMMRNLASAGFQSAGIEDSDFLLINSCAVTESAERKFHKFLRKCKRENPGIKIWVTGCLSEMQSEELQANGLIDSVLSMDEKSNIAKILKNSIEGEAFKTLFPSQHRSFFPAWSHSERTRSFLKIQDGCENHCSYCTIPLARGPHRSDEVPEVVKRIQMLADSGVQEVILSGVNLSEFEDSSGNRLPQLLFAIEEQSAIPRLRISSLEPNRIKEKLLDQIADSKIVQPHFHIPLQSGSDSILKKMARKYNSEHFQKTIELIRNRMPEAGIGLDVIVGFPGESDALFEETRQFIDALDLSYLHVFSYSKRPNTLAAEMLGQLSHAEKQSRSRILHRLAEAKRAAFQRKMLGSTHSVLLEKFSAGALFGHAGNYETVQFNGPESLVNTIQSLKILRSEAQLCIGEAA